MKNIGWVAMGRQCLGRELMRTIGNKVLAAKELFSYSSSVAANSATGFSSPNDRRTAPLLAVFLCSLYGELCMGGVFARRVPVSRSTNLCTVRHHLFSSSVGELQLNTGVPQ